MAASISGSSECCIPAAIPPGPLSEVRIDSLVEFPGSCWREKIRQSKSLPGDKKNSKNNQGVNYDSKLPIFKYFIFVITADASDGLNWVP